MGETKGRAKPQHRQRLQGVPDQGDAAADDAMSSHIGLTSNFYYRVQYILRFGVKLMLSVMVPFLLEIVRNGGTRHEK